MTPMQVHFRVSPSRRDEDRVLVERFGQKTLIAVADGAGGTGGGREAAEAACELIRTHAAEAGRLDWASVLSSIDAEIGRRSRGGLTTAVVVVLDEQQVYGASVGDSGAWMSSSNGCLDLTADQARKPLLGSGDARPVAFGSTSLNGRILVATDGLLKYAHRDVLLTALSAGSVETAVEALIASVTLPSGELHDDVAVVVAEAAV